MKRILNSILQVNDWLKDLPLDSATNDITWFNKERFADDAIAAAARGEALRREAGIDGAAIEFNDDLVNRYADIFVKKNSGACAEAACAEFRVIRQQLENADVASDSEGDEPDDPADFPKVFLIAVDHKKPNMPTYKHVFTVIARPSQWVGLGGEPTVATEKFSLITALKGTALVVDYWFNADYAYDYDEDEDPLAKAAAARDKREPNSNVLLQLQKGPTADPEADGKHHQAATFQSYVALTEEHKDNFNYRLDQAKIVFRN